MPEGNNNLNGHVVNSVIDFNMIVNTDIGLIKFIQDSYQDNRVFKLEDINRSDREILSLLYSRKNPNPLSEFVNEEFIGEIDSLYKSFFDSYKQEILDHSIIFSNIYKFVSMATANGINLGINTAIAIRDDLEEKELDKHFSIANFLNKDSDKSLIMKREVFYINDYLFFNKNREKILHKKIYITPMQYNLDFLEQDKSKFVTQNQFIFFGEDFKLKGENNDGTEQS